MTVEHQSMKMTKTRIGEMVKVAGESVAKVKDVSNVTSAASKVLQTDGESAFQVSKRAMRE